MSANGNYCYSKGLRIRANKQLAALLSRDDRTLLIDGDPNHSALQWAKRGELPFQVVDLMAASRHTRNCEHVVFDTPARPNQDDLEALVDGCDLLLRINAEPLKLTNGSH